MVSFRLTGTPVAGLILVRLGVQIKSVEGNALDADPDLGQSRANLGVEPVAIHAEIERCVPQPN